MTYSKRTEAMPRRAHRTADSAPWDRLGIVASTLCLLHCLAVPVLVSVLAILPRPVPSGTANIDGGSATAPPAVQVAAGRDWLRYVCCSPQADRWMHCVALCVVAPVGGIALWNGFERHRSPWGLLLGAPSLLLLMLGVGLGTIRPGLDLQRTATLLGSLLLIAAHLCNRHCDRCTTHSAEHLAEKTGSA